MSLEGCCAKGPQFVWLGSHFIRGANWCKKKYGARGTNVPGNRNESTINEQINKCTAGTVLHKGPPSGGHGNEVFDAITKRQVISLKVQEALVPIMPGFTL